PCTQGAILGRATIRSRTTFDSFSTLFTPLSGAGPKAAAEAGVEKAQVVKAALFGDVDDFCVVVAQEGNCPEQAHFHAQSGYGIAEVLVEQPIEMAPAATKTIGEFVHGKGQHIIRRQAF